jgi:hypothetical protein
LRLPVLPLDRILHSKLTTGRPKDLAAVHAIEDALVLLAEGEGEADDENTRS